ncbi:MAG: polysaccharide lyase family 8 super-sandwich domain-containing protein, partial [Stackebrandtia sp.]
AYAIAMCSKRIAYYECGNGENNLGFHTGEGMTSLYTQNDNGQFIDGFWPTVDYYRMPGTTIDTKPLQPGAGGEFGDAVPRRSTWVGGAGLAGESGAVGMDVEGILAPLTGRKSWFCLGDHIVALGAGITDTSDATVETIVENRNLHADGANVLVLDGEEQPAEPGWEVRRPVRWAHLDGVAGYVLGRGTTLSAKREERTGRWRDVNSAGSVDPVTRRWLTMWIDHGSGPENAAYSYIIAPRASRDATRRLAEGSEIRVLSNTSELQAVKARRLDTIAANFWARGRLGHVRVSAPCSILIRERDRQLTVAVADPTQLRSGISVTILRSGYRNWVADDTITVRSAGPLIRFDVDTAGAAGSTHTVTFLR